MSVHMHWCSCATGDLDFLSASWVSFKVTAMWLLQMQQMICRLCRCKKTSNSCQKLSTFLETL